MDYLNKFEVYLENEKKISSSTLSAYMSDLKEYEAFIKNRGKLIEKAGNADVAAYMMVLTNGGKSASTINRKLSSIRNFYNCLIAENRINYNPTSNIKAPRIEKKALDYFSQEEILRLIEAPENDDRGKRDRALFEVMYATGMRVNEICDINVEDVDFRIGYINIRSSSRPRVVPIGKPARAALKDYISSARINLLGGKDDSKALFLSYMGERLTRQGVWKILKLYSEKTELGDRLSPQIIRNTFAVHLVQNGADLKSLQELLGHEDINATKIYLSVTKARLIDVYDKAFPRA